MDWIDAIARLTGKSRADIVKHEEYNAGQRDAWATNRHGRRDRGMVRTMNARVATLGIPGAVTVEEWVSVCVAHNFTCPHCGKQKPLTMDHIQPLSKGGAHSRENVQPLCRSCNSRKGTK